MVLPGKITAQGWALAPIAVATRPQGAPLTVILGGKRMPGTEDGPGPSQVQPSTQRYGGDRRSAEAGQPDLGRRRRAPQGYRPKGRDMAAAPESDSSPASSPAWSWRWCPSQLGIPARWVRVHCLRPGHRPGAWRAEGAPLKP